jgi:hypothetical protein
MAVGDGPLNMQMKFNQLLAIFAEFFTTRYMYCRRSPIDHANFELE